MKSGMKKIGLIVNPVAGIGGRVGLKGSDGAEIQERAILLGAIPRANERAQTALRQLLPMKERFELLCAPGAMGESAALKAGFEPTVVGEISDGKTCSDDTRRIASKLKNAGAELVLFAGGDGTARDILDAVGNSCPVIGIPAGVKIHSAVYAVNPTGAGRATANFIESTAPWFHDAEVMDIDEDAFRQNRVSAKLYGYMKTPTGHHMQNAKAGGYSELEALNGIASEIIESMENDTLYLFGPGTTMQAVLHAMGLESTLLGVDAVKNGSVIAADADEKTVLRLLDENRKARIIVTVIGGQGHIFGRGNHQFSPEVLLKVGVENICVAATKKKLTDIFPESLLVDTGDPKLDEKLCGYRKVITGRQEYMIARIEC